MLVAPYQVSPSQPRAMVQNKRCQKEPGLCSGFRIGFAADGSQVDSSSQAFGLLFFGEDL